MRILNVCWKLDLEPEQSDSSADISLADEDDEHEETSQHVTAVDDSEKIDNDIILQTRFSEVVMNNEMDIFSNPRNPENEKKFQIKNLKIH